MVAVIACFLTQFPMVTKVPGLLLAVLGSSIIFAALIILGVFIRPIEPEQEPAPPKEAELTEEQRTKIVSKLPLIQYNRISNEYLSVEGFLWQAPSIALTVAAALVIGAFQFLPFNAAKSDTSPDAILARTVVLLIAASLLLVMAQVTVKHRFNAAWRLHWLEEFGDNFRLHTIPPIPIGTHDQIKYVKGVGGGHWDLIRGNFPERVIRQSSHLLLAYLLIGAAIVIIGLAVYTAV